MSPRSLLPAVLFAASVSHDDRVDSYGRCAGGGRFSPLTDITRANVARLRVAWTYQHRDFWKGRSRSPSMSVPRRKSTPVVVDGRFFFTTPANRVIALEPETGRELWSFDPKLERGRNYANMWIKPWCCVLA